MYKIYVNEHIIRVREGGQSFSGCIQLTDSKEDIITLLAHIRRMLDASKTSPPMCLEVVTASARNFLKNLKQSILYVKAAGGLVKNDLKEYLFIFRRGKWDLPKGKLEEREKPEKAALREVEEECGIKVHLVKKELGSTYHFYDHHGRLILKRTCWYLMKGDASQVLVPQAEEDITEARWFKTSELDLIRSNTYPSVIEVLEAINT